MRARTTRTVARSQRPGGEDAHEVEVLYRLGAGLVAEPAPPADPARLRPLLTAPQPGAAVRGGVVLQAGPKWRATGVADAVLRRIVERLRPYGLRVLAGPGEAEAVRGGDRGRAGRRRSSCGPGSRRWPARPAW